jgi:comEA protein
MNILKENRSEKILISTALAMFAAIIGYNAFFVPEMPNMVQTSGNIISKKAEKETKEIKSKNEGLVNLNTASEDELVENLTGVGPVMAKRIISYRETHGGFSSVDELMNIKGIGEKIFAKLKNDVTV